jgi:FixJ family two-component response regulator
MGLTSTVYIVDDDASVRRSMERLCKAAGYSVLTFATAEQFLEYPWRLNGTGCLILDVSMPGRSGLEVQKALADSRANPPIIFLTGHGDIPMSVGAMKAGAFDFLTKPPRQAEILKAVASAVERHQQAQTLSQELEEIGQRMERLTPRERQVMELVLLGLLNKQIADKLGSAEKTVKVHRGRVMRKMEVQSVAELVRDVGKFRANE